MILLDTHVLLWLLTDNLRLGQTARSRISGAVAVHVSAATILELSIKSMLGKIETPADLDSQIERSGLSPLPITARHAGALRDFPELLKHDPFDRILAAQAHVDGLELMTTDRVLLALDRPQTFDARL